MNIAKWNDAELMKLPDHLFGSRFVVSCEAAMLGVGQTFDMSEIALPERCVIWELIRDCPMPSGVGDGYRLALGDQLPTTHAQFMALDPLISGLGAQGPEPRLISQRYVGVGASVRNIKQFIRPAGRRLVVEAHASTGPMWVIILLVVSSVPQEIPDWFYLPQE